MIIEEKILIKNYKCFTSSFVGFESIYPINIIIGKNNSGKSSLIDLIEFVTDPKQELKTSSITQDPATVRVVHKITETDIKRAFPRNVSGGNIGQNHFEYGLQFKGNFFEYTLKENNKKELHSVSAKYVPEAKGYFQKMVEHVEKPFSQKTFIKLTAERDILPENDTAINSNFSLSPNGTGATKLIASILNHENLDSKIIETQFLSNLNKILNPEINFSRVLVQKIANNSWEVFIDKEDSTRVALSKMGSGIKTIILTLLQLYIVPWVKGKKPKDFVFAFEELENNLHPSLQRKLFKFILEYQRNQNAHFFITTHSNIVIDIFSNQSTSQIIHIKNTRNGPSIDTVITKRKSKTIIADLGIKASDILQSNGIIWVEGPSDRNYLIKWISLIDSTLSEGIHFTIMFYGGKLLANTTFETESPEEMFVNLFRINTNSFVVMDRDGNTTGSRINKTKKRIKEEVGEENCWITKGREIENYLLSKTVTDWLDNDIKGKETYSFDKDKKIDDCIKTPKNSKFKYSSNKTFYSSQITNYITNESLDHLDLRERIEQIVQKIQEWNE